jgi:polyisoprenoid-binding protein YceI
MNVNPLMYYSVSKKLRVIEGGEIMAKWIIDPDHTAAIFSIRHLMIANVRGHFSKITGIIYFDISDITHSSFMS